MKLLITICIFFLYSCSSNSNELEEEIQTIQLQNFGGSGECSNWVKLSDVVKFNNVSDRLFEHLIVIESSNPNQLLPDTLGKSYDIIKFTGRFYKNNYGYSKTCRNRAGIEKGRIFNYTAYEVIKSHYHDYEAGATHEK
ncbi:hypothetical protein A4D02_16090 [Niastella koreensis]|uniref:Lipoprotein n=2 Tax=Niastella koreensis TaxID=354356 RepID=G8TN67_NIAKG|nr:hypothetical protein [Niastella koreensis]AEV97752.1 hypothetical protein Niako_1381 [Niastella koreensis GR20-10]OQP40433.1 hypothetical protein A4D02_16090 [Niastella koreensis]